jgi:hypothetical protein
MTNRYWIRWSTSDKFEEFDIPFKFWADGVSRTYFKIPERFRYFYVAVVEAESEAEIKDVLWSYSKTTHLYRCEQVAWGWIPNNRFPDFDGKRTHLYHDHQSKAKKFFEDP